MNGEVPHYALGFAFCLDHTDLKVLLIQKARPLWQKGYFNGVGGSIEKRERPLAAMVREFKEETGVVTSPEDWTHTVTMKVEDREHGHRAVVEVYAAELHPMTLRAAVSHSLDGRDETLTLLPVRNLYGMPVIPNLHWLVPLQRAPLRFPLDIVEHSRGGW